MKILYFSWIKDGIGKSQEDIILNESIKNISDLINFLITAPIVGERFLIIVFLNLSLIF